MAQALHQSERWQHRFDDLYPIIVGGEERAGNQTFEAIDPSVGQPWTRLTEATGDDVDAAVVSARKAFKDWRRLPPAARQELLGQIADRVASDPIWPMLLATENGRAIREAKLGDVPAAVAVFRYFAALTRNLDGLNLDTGNRDLRAWTVREPLGVVAAITPWNSPLISTAAKLAPALAAGNTVVLKPSEFASASVIEFGRRIADILPPGVVNIITGGARTGSALVSHSEVNKVSFTGGVPTARSILHAAADTVTPALLELGGKSALIICSDADLDLAIEDALKGILFQNGQVCFAASRLLLHGSVHDEFLERFTARIAHVKIGDALDPATEMGPLVSAQHRDRVDSHVQRARANGAAILIGGGPREMRGPLRGGYFFEPTVIADPDGSSDLSRTEVFGPVVAVTPWDSEEDVIALANSTTYGLAVGVWTRDLARVYRFTDELVAGTVWVNTWFDVVPGLPRGGYKDSGYGREMAAETLLEYTAPKGVVVRLSTERPPLWSNFTGSERSE